MSACEKCGNEIIIAEERRAEINMRLLELAGRMRPKGASTSILVEDAIYLQKFVRDPVGWDS